MPKKQNNSLPCKEKFSHQSSHLEVILRNVQYFKYSSAITTYSNSAYLITKHLQNHLLHLSLRLLPPLVRTLLKEMTLLKWDNFKGMLIWDTVCIIRS